MDGVLSPDFSLGHLHLWKVFVPGPTRYVEVEAHNIGEAHREACKRIGIHPVSYYAFYVKPMWLKQLEA